MAGLEVLVEALQNSSVAKLERLETSGLLKELDLRVLKYLRKISLSLPEEYTAELLKIYAGLLRSIDKESLNLVINLANDALAAGEQLKNSKESDEIEYLVESIFTKISTSAVLEYNQFQIITDLLQKQKPLEALPDLNEACELINSGNVLGMQILISTFCSFKSYHEQFVCIETELVPVIASFRSIKSLEMFIQAFNFLNTLLVCPVYYIEQSGKVAPYSSDTSTYYNIHKKSFQAIWDMILIILQSDMIVSQNLIKIIPKVWEIYPEHQEEMLGETIGFLKNISQSAFLESLTASAHFVYNIFTDPHTSLQVKKALKAELPEIFNDLNFVHVKKPSMDLESCRINDGFPLLVKVPAGERFVLSLCVEKNSILYCAFVVDNYDIGFTVKTKKKMLASLKYSKNNEPSVTRLVFEHDERVRIEWDNTFSWVNSKQIRYRVMLLRKNQELTTINTYRLKGNSENKVSVLLYERCLSIFTSEAREELYNSNSGLESLKKYVENFEDFELNIITEFEITEKQLKGLENVVWGIDIEVAGLYASKKLQIPTLIVVKNQKSCVIVDGQVQKTHKTLGDISNLPNNSIGASVKMLSDLFPNSEILLFQCESQEWLREDLLSRNLPVIDCYLDGETLLNSLRDLLNT